MRSQRCLWQYHCMRAINSGGSHLGVRLLATPPPLLRPNGVNSRPCTCVQGPKKIPHTPSEHCNCATVAVYCTLNHQTNVVAHNGENGLVQARERQAATVGSRLATQQGHRPPLRKDRESTTSDERQLRHQQNLSCTTTGMGTTRQELQLWKTTIFCTSGPHTNQEAARPAQQGSLCPATGESLGYKDHEDLPLRNDRDDDDHDELELRNFRSFVNGAINCSCWSIPAMIQRIRA